MMWRVGACVTHRVRVALLLCAGTGMGACHRVAALPSAGAAPVAGAGPSAIPNQCDPRNPSASMTGRVLLTFSGAANGEAVIRIESETPRATVRVPVAEGTLMELREGRYILHIAVGGYRSVDQPIAVTCGKDIKLPITLTRR